MRCQTVDGLQVQPFPIVGETELIFLQQILVADTEQRLQQIANGAGAVVAIGAMQINRIVFAVRQVCKNVQDGLFILLLKELSIAGRVVIDMLHIRSQRMRPVGIVAGAQIHIRFDFQDIQHILCSFRRQLVIRCHDAVQLTSSVDHLLLDMFSLFRRPAADVADIHDAVDGKNTRRVCGMKAAFFDTRTSVGECDLQFIIVYRICLQKFDGKNASPPLIEVFFCIGKLLILRNIENCLLDGQIFGSVFYIIKSIQRHGMIQTAFRKPGIYGVAVHIDIGVNKFFDNGGHQQHLFIDGNIKGNPRAFVCRFLVRFVCFHAATPSKDHQN